MHDNRRLVEERIRRELNERLRPALHAERHPFVIEAWSVPGEPVAYAEAAAARYEPFALGGSWGRPWGTTWFRLSAVVPAAWVGRPVEAVIDLGFRWADPGFQAEGLVWTADGPLQGVHPRRTAVPLPEAKAGEAVELLVEAAANPSSPTFLPSPMGALDHRTRPAPLPPGHPGGAGGARPHGARAGVRRGGAGRDDAGAAAERPAPSAVAADA